MKKVIRNTSSHSESVLRAVHVIAGLRNSDGGPTYSVPRLCGALSSVHVEVTLLSVGESLKSYSNADSFKDCRFAWQYAKVPVLRDLRISSELADALGREVDAADVVHNHGLWLMPNLNAGWATSGTKRPLIIAPRGMLSATALSFSRKKKAVFWHLFQGPAISHASCFHATSYQEYEEIRAFGVGKPVAIIPNGIDLPKMRGKQLRVISDDRVILSLGRIHPKKSLDTLVCAWAKLEALYPQWRLRIVGPAELGHDDELRALAKKLKLKRLTVEMPVFGIEKWAVLEGADVFVLPTLNENFAMTVAESLAVGTPVIATKGAPWAGLETERCGWWIETGAESLALALNQAMMLPKEELVRMGARGQAWMARDFEWDAIAKKMRAVYLWLTNRRPRPHHVIVD